MVFAPERSTINQKIQLGAESTSALGTAVPASKSIGCFDFQFGASTDITEYAPTGHKYTNVQNLNEEWVDGTMSGDMDYNGLIYPLSSAMGAVSPTTHGSSTTAKDWVFVPPITGSVVPQTYTFEQGDSTRAHKLSYGLFTQFGYTFDRKSATASGKVLARQLTDGITMTASPTAIPLKPIVPGNFNVYLDPTQTALGTTQLPKVISGAYTMDSIYGPAWFVNRANASFSSHVDTMPKCTLKLILEADATGMALLTYMRSGVTYYVRVEAIGGVIDNLQTVTLGTPSAGTFTLTYKGQTTAGIAYNAASSVVQTALTGLSSVGAGNATVTGGIGGPYTITMTGTLAGDATALTGDGTGLTGGTFAITQSPVTHALIHDMAVKIGKPDQFSDSAGVYAIGFECTIAEDSTWGKAQQLTLTNVLTTL